MKKDIFTGILFIFSCSCISAQTVFIQTMNEKDMYAYNPTHGNEIYKYASNPDEGIVNCCGWLGNVIKDAGKVLVKTVTAPTETAIKAAGVAVGVNKPADVFQPLKDVASSGADLLQVSKPLVTFLNAPQEMLYKQAGDFAKKLGPGGTFLFDLTTFSQKFYNQLLPVGTDELILLLKGKNPLTLVAAPLAAAIHAAELRHAPNAKPLPPDVLEGLKSYFPADVLSKARYTVGTVEITLPNFIGQGRKIFMGDHYAVVVDDIIVFNKVPPSFKDGAWWWAHEVNHISQYNSWGVEVFAYNYIKDLGKSVEEESDKKGDEVLAGISTATGTVVLTPRDIVFKVPESFRNNDKIIWQCIIDGDKLPASYLVTSKGKILAVNPLTGEYVHIGYAEPPIFVGSAWTFKTSKVQYAVLANGNIVQSTSVKNPSGQVIRVEAHKIGEVKKIEPAS